LLAKYQSKLAYCLINCSAIWHYSSGGLAHLYVLCKGGTHAACVAILISASPVVGSHRALIPEGKTRLAAPLLLLPSKDRGRRLLRPHPLQRTRKGGPPANDLPRLRYRPSNQSRPRAAAHFGAGLSILGSAPWAMMNVAMTCTLTVAVPGLRK
jgi:hypothetical protein